jgi:NAD-dependent dihydropyrimidine dehydrogenase PreA subunit
MKDNEIVLLVCDCGGNNPALIEGIAASGLDADAYVIRDLCGAALAKSVELSAILKSYRRQIVLACFPRAARALFAQCGVDAPSAEFINLQDGGLASALDGARGLGVDIGVPRVYHLDSELSVPSWFPVIDRERCTACGICADFCLFGVYRKALGKKPEVQKPLNCKNNCPACARKCPASAVIFPKIPERGVIAGAEVGKPHAGVPAQNEGGRPARSSLLRPDVAAEIEQGRLRALREKENSEDHAHD